MHGLGRTPGLKLQIGVCMHKLGNFAEHHYGNNGPTAASDWGSMRAEEQTYPEAAKWRAQVEL